jgi:tetratricopeptide (TPR) repeat protein
MLLRLLAFAFLLFPCLTSPALAAPWNEARTRHFIIYSQSSPERLRSWAERLERFDTAVRQVRGYKDPPLTDGSRLTIYDLRSVAEVQKLLPLRSSGVGFYIPRASGSVAFVSRNSSELRGELDADHILQHEYAHHLMLSDPASPLAAWLVEGSAEFFATATVEADGGVRIGAPPRVRANAVLRDIGFNAGDLLAGAKPRDQRDRESIYAKGWLLTHYLAFNKAREGQLTRYLEAIGRGEPARAAAQAAFGDLKQLDRELDDYGRSTFPALRVAPGPRPEVTVRTLGAGENAIMPFRIRADRGILPRDAATLAAEARKVAAVHPSDAAVQAVLAEVELAARNWRPAIDAADKALAADPRHVGAMVTKGRALLMEARGKGSQADWSEVRRWLVRANRADTEHAEPLYLFYRSFVDAGQKPTADAVKGLHYAHALAPSDIGLRFASVRQHLMDGQVQEARRKFAAIVFNPHLDLEGRPQLTVAMERMRAGDGSGALVAIDADYRARKAGDRAAAD